MDSHYLIAFCAYFTILALIGYLSYKKQSSDSDFIVGNRSLNFWVIALSAHASDMSSWLFMAFPAAIMVRGIPQIWIAVGLMLGMFLNWQFVAARLRRATEELDCYTLSSFFERRFKDTSGTLSIVTAVMAVFFLCYYLAAGLISLGLLFESIFGINYYFGLAVGAGVVMIYTFVGGFITVAWTDLFQAIFLMLMILLVPYTAFMTLEHGFDKISLIAQTKQISFGLVDDYSWESITTIIVLIFGWGLGYFGQPHIVTKFMGIKDATEMNKSKYIGMSWMAIALMGATAVGLVGIGFFPDGMQQPQLVFIEMVKQLFTPLGAGFILCGIIAASMSTMDSQLLVCASVLSEDLYKKLINKNAKPSHMLFVTRLGVLITALFALGISFSRSATVMDTVAYAWSGLGSSFGPVVLAALYSKKANRIGAMAGILVGGFISATWGWLNPMITNVAIMPMIPGVILGTIAIHLFSRLFPVDGGKIYGRG